MDEDFRFKNELEFILMHKHGNVNALLNEMGDAEFNSFITADFIKLNGDVWIVNESAKNYYIDLFGALNYWLLLLKNKFSKKWQKLIVKHFPK